MCPSYHSKISATKRRMGLSVDWAREAFTMDQPRREAVTEAFVCTATARYIVPTVFSIEIRGYAQLSQASKWTTSN